MHFNDNIDALNTIRFVNGTNRSIFLTGKAGTGKTTLLRNIVQNTHKNTVIVAPTGIAALNAGGVTIHSMFQMPFGAFVPTANLQGIESVRFQVHTLQQLPKEIVKLSSVKRTVIRQMELLIIDEVSMLRADLLDAIDTILKHIRRRRQDPFGGVQVLFIGDMLQLPPIVKEEEWQYLSRFYKSLYFFDAQVFEYQKPIVIELGKIYRQSDFQFVSILNNLRNNIFTKEDLQVLNSYYKPNFERAEQDSYIFITTHNRKADAINSEELQKLESETYTYTPDIRLEFPENLYPIEFSMDLKEGAQVMFIKNDYSGGSQYYNGKIGKIHSLSKDSISVIFPETGVIVNVDKYTWENKRFVLDNATGLIEETVIGTFTHYPLKLAWAVTVHKSQGLTFKQAIIDVSEAFAPGQIYVALSRLESLEGLVLSEPIVADAPDQNERLLSFTNKKHTHTDLEQEYKTAAQNYLHTAILETFDMHPLLQEINYHIDSYTKEENRSMKQNFLGEIKQIKEQVLPIIEVGDKFIRQLTTIISSQESNNQLKERITAAINFFEPLLEEISENIFKIITQLQDLKGVKAYITELKTLEIQYFNRIKKMRKCVLLIDAIVNNETIKKEALTSQPETAHRKALLSEKPSTKKGKKQKTVTEKLTSTTNKTSKKNEPNTKEITFEMYSKGMSIEKIAKEREYAVTTIEGHLAYFIAEGMLEIDDFVEKSKITTIKKTIASIQSKSLKEIKEQLPEGYSYSDIRFTMAYLECMNQL